MLATCADGEGDEEELEPEGDDELPQPTAVSTTTIIAIHGIFLKNRLIRHPLLDRKRLVRWRPSYMPASLAASDSDDCF